MKTYEINKTFPDEKACDAWKEKNVPNRKYDGREVFMINHECNANRPEIKITTIITL